MGRMRKFSQAFSSLYVSITALVTANLIPLTGALFWNWELFEIVFLYWFESAIVGFYTILKMAWVELAPEKTGEALSRKRILVFLLHALIFFLPLGAFMTLYFFLIYVFGREINPGLPWASDPPGLTTAFRPLVFVYVMFVVLVKILPPMMVPALALFVSHGISFWYNFVGRKEYMRFGRAGEIAFTPYERIFPVIGTIFAGLILMIIFGVPMLFVAALILLKTFVDLRSHMEEYAGSTHNPQQGSEF